MKDTELRAYLKACRKAARDGEIAAHGRPVNINRIHKSKKVYDRKRIKAADKKSLPFYVRSCVETALRHIRSAHLIKIKVFVIFLEEWLRFVYFATGFNAV